MPDNFQYDVFLSYNSKDKLRVRRLAERLQTAGVRVWLDDWVIKPGDDIYLAIEHGLKAARVQVLCLSQAALDSEWVSLERSTVLFRDPGNKGRRFIPLLLDDCDLPDTLRRYKYVDFREESEAGFAEVLGSCLVQTEDAPEVRPPKEAQSTLTERFFGKRRAEQPQEIEPLAVLERKIKGHKDWVNSVAVSPDGTWVASGSKDNTVKIWDMETGKCRATLTGHTSDVTSVAITPNGKRILSGSSDKSVRVWDVGSGQTLAQLDGYRFPFWSTVTLQDNIRALSGGFDNTLTLWDITSCTRIRTIKCGAGGMDDIFICAVNGVGNQALSGHESGLLQLWDLESGECLANMNGHSELVHSVQITPDGCFAVSGSDDKTVKVWDLKARTCVVTLEGHQREVVSVAISPDGGLIASTGFTDNMVRLWDWKSGTCLQVITNDEYLTPISVTFSPDGSRLVVGTANTATLYVYKLTGTRSVPSAEETRRYVNAKVVLLGEGTVGKTSLAHRLIDDEYVIKDRTHGMNVWRLDLPSPPLNREDRPLSSPFTPSAGEGDIVVEYEALLWDLAGQEDYRLIHQLFLEQTALALLLVNPQKDDPFVEAGEWLKALKTATNDTKQEAARLLIFSQVDVGGPKLGDSKVNQFCKEHSFTGWLLTSAKNGRNCSDKESGGQPSKLKQLIAASIPWDKLPWTSTPRLLAELKNAVMEMHDEQDIRLLRFSELAQRLEQALPDEKFGESDVRTAVTLLANHGLARQLKFGDLVLLRPDLLNGYAGAVIRAARAHTDEIGCVLEADIYQPDFDFTGVERLGRRGDEELLLRAMVEEMFLYKSLCIAENTPHGRHLIFPSQYRREKDTPKNPDIFVSYTFSGEWQTVWTTLVVHLWYSQEFAHRELWRNAAEFASAKDHTLGLLINKEGDGAATISLYFDAEVPDELRVLFIEYVHRHLARYACGVVRDRRYICSNPNCKKPVTDLDAVRKRLAANKDFITCQECDEKVLLIDFIEQRLKSDPVAQKILAMDQTISRELDTQALEQILIGHMMAIAGEANQIFRPVTMFDYGIDGEVEFKDNDGKASGRKIYVQLKSGNSYLRTRKGDGSEVFDVSNERHLDYWITQPVDVYLVIRQKDEMSNEEAIRWMNVTRYLNGRKDKKSRRIIFAGEKLDMEAVWKVRDGFFPPGQCRK